MISGYQQQCHKYDLALTCVNDWFENLLYATYLFYIYIILYMYIHIFTYIEYTYIHYICVEYIHICRIYIYTFYIYVYVYTYTNICIYIYILYIHTHTLSCGRGRRAVCSSAPHGQKLGSIRPEAVAATNRRLSTPTLTCGSFFLDLSLLLKSDGVELQSAVIHCGVGCSFWNWNKLAEGMYRTAVGEFNTEHCGPTRIMASLY